MVTQDHDITKEFTQSVIDVALHAGKAIMEVYESGNFEESLKSDSSPLTKADKVSHRIIVDGLAVLDETIPILSEEGSQISYEERKHWRRFWLVDPLDGTKEFLKRNGEFTVNIALIEGGRPILGVIYIPATGVLYYGERKRGAFRRSADGATEQIRVVPPENGKIIAARSRSHAAPEEEDFFKRHGVTETVSAGSSLKFCLVAEGKAHVYYRHGPTMEWDTAAGQAIAENAGCRVLRFDRDEALIYNKESLLNPWFVVLR